MSSSNQVTAIDLFAGCGGLSLGLMKAGIKGLFAVEKNNDAFSTLKHNLLDIHKHFDWPDWLEIKAWNVVDLIETHRDELAALSGTIDIVVGGPPCQGFSMAGLRKHDDIRNQLMNYYLEFVRIVQPAMLFFENVHGFTIPFQTEDGKGITYSEILKGELTKMGYFYQSCMIDMSEFGVPQRRKRFVLFASKNPRQAEFFIQALYSRRTNFLQSKAITAPVTVSEAIGDLRRSVGEVPSVDSPKFMNGLYAREASKYQHLMRSKLKKGSVPDSHRFVKHKGTTIDLFKKLMAIGPEQVRVTPSSELVSGLKKRGVTPLKATSVCPTLTSIPDDFVHYSEPRIMTVREHARIQSFPDDFVFLGPYTTGGIQRRSNVPRYTQVANAVPPLFAEQVGEAIFASLEKLDKGDESEGNSPF